LYRPPFGGLTPFSGKGGKGAFFASVSLHKQRNAEKHQSGVAFSTCKESEEKTLSPSYFLPNKQKKLKTYQKTKQ
jgi:hypothetical protein